MSHDEAVTLGLQLAGGVGIGASVTFALIAFDQGTELLPSLRFFGIGLVSMLAAQPEKKPVPVKK